MAAKTLFLFAIRAFHDAVLRHGAVPLSVLEMLVDAHIAKELARGT